MDEELNPDNDQIFFDLPRPKGDDPVDPEPAFVNHMPELHTHVATPAAPDGYDGYTSLPEKSI